MELTTNMTVLERNAGYWDWGINYMYNKKGDIPASWPSGRYYIDNLFWQWILDNYLGDIKT